MLFVNLFWEILIMDWIVVSRISLATKGEGEVGILVTSVDTAML